MSIQLPNSYYKKVVMQNRRQFLKNSYDVALSLAVGGVALGSSATSEAASKPSPKAPQTKKVRVGVVGGRFGTQFQFAEHPGSIVTAVSDLIPNRREKLKQVYKCDKAYNSLEEMLPDKAVDAIAVFTDAPSHVAHSIAAMKAGKHVFCSVPAAQSLEDCHKLFDCVKETGMIYMMAETSYYYPSVMSARQFYKDGAFGDIMFTESEYHHPGIEALMFDTDGKKTWRHGRPPMYQGSHCSAYLVGVTGERLTEVSCIGIADESEPYKKNQYNNPFSVEIALFRTNKGNAVRILRSWKGAFMDCVRGQWLGTKMSLYGSHPNGLGPVIVKATPKKGADDAGFALQENKLQSYTIPTFYEAEMLPEALRHSTGHSGSHSFLTHEFVDALKSGRKSAIDILTSLAMVAPVVAAHESAMQGGREIKIPQF